MPAGREAPRLDSICHKRGIFARGELPRGGTADECLRPENTGCAEVFHTREGPGGGGQSWFGGDRGDFLVSEALHSQENCACRGSRPLTLFAGLSPNGTNGYGCMAKGIVSAGTAGPIGRLTLAN